MGCWLRYVTKPTDRVCANGLEAILFLCSKEARWITGLIMPVDGGTTAGKADRPALKADSLAEQNASIQLAETTR